MEKGFSIEASSSLSLDSSSRAASSFSSPKVAKTRDGASSILMVRATGSICRDDVPQ